MSVEKYRVLIADDEQLTRIGIRYFITKMAEYEVVDEAINGQETLEKILMLNPDIVLLDIKMPLYSGLEVLESLHKIKHPAKIILLSGYDDFHFAQKALKYGACDYLLKPTTYENLLEAFSKVKTMIQNEKTVQDKMKVTEKYKDGALSLFLPQFFLRIIKKEFTDREYNEKLDLFEIPYSDMRVILVGPDRMFSLRTDSSEEMYNVIITKIIYQINEYIRTKGLKYSCSFLIEKDTLALVLFTEECSNKDVTNFVRDLREHLNAILGMTSTISMGKEFPLINASESYADARKKLNQRFFVGENRIIFELDQHSADDKIQCADFEKAILNAIRYQDMKGTKALIDEFYHHLDSKRIPKEEWLRFCYEISFSISNLIQDYSMDNEPDGLIDEIGIIAGLSSVHDVKDWLSKIITDAAMLLQGGGSEQPLIIRKAMKYIENHYKEHISLTELADHVSLSLNYFSSLFKQTTGKTVLEYITCRRMLEAKRLLKYTQLNVSEIAYQLGYINPRYFSEVFQRNENMTPTQYRKSL